MDVTQQCRAASGWVFRLSTTPAQQCTAACRRQPRFQVHCLLSEAQLARQPAARSRRRTAAAVSSQRLNRGRRPAGALGSARRSLGRRRPTAPLPLPPLPAAARLPPAHPSPFSLCLHNSSLLPRPLLQPAMDFTDRLACSGPPPVFSPDRKLLASADGYRLVVRAADSLAVVCLASCLDRIEALAWSPDSDHILCGLFKRATVQVFCVSDPDWTCSIAEGPAGVTAARWTPDGRHILLTADFNLRLSVWSLVDQSCQYLRGPKHAAAGLAFSPDGAQLAVLHVRWWLQQGMGWWWNELAGCSASLQSCRLQWVHVCCACWAWQPLPCCSYSACLFASKTPSPNLPCIAHHILTLTHPPQRSDCKDSLAVYDCSTWAVRAQWGLATADAADLAWSPDGSCLAVWESALYGHQLAVYTPEVGGDLWGRF